ncbi:MAG: aminopeptidase [Chloroflexota bacterium]
MPDPRIESYARLLVERCLDVKPGWQVMVRSTPLARPLLEAVARSVAHREAYLIPRIAYASTGLAWAEEAPEALLATLPPVEQYTLDHVDAYIAIGAPENTRDGSTLSPERIALGRQSEKAFRARTLSLAVPWVVCQFPTPALAQEAGMTLSAYEEFLYGACLLDWDETGKAMRRIADRFDRAGQVRIVGDGTDLTFSLSGRHGQVDDGHYNMPGGEVFYCPVEDSVDGDVTFSEFPAVWMGHLVEGVHLTFKDGRVIDASAKTGEDLLIKTLDADPGARGLGEFGIGCNPGIQRHLKSTLFDEKIGGTIHLAVGAGFPFLGGTNVSSVHWDMVKDLRQQGQILCDGESVQVNGHWQW